jgi:2-dehydropantoate 2-reductase
MTRYIVFGAGSLGCHIGGRLHLAKREVLLVARGAHRAAMAKNGLRLKTVAIDEVVHATVVATISEVTLRPDDTVLLGMKSHDCAAALPELAAAAPPGIAVICAQSSTENERMALRFFENVYGASVLINVAVMAPGVVHSYTYPIMGLIDIGRYPEGSDKRSATYAADLKAAGFLATDCADVMKWKRGKVVTNGGTNVVRAACPKTDIPDDLIAEAREEGAKCFNVAKLDFATADVVLKRVFDTNAFGQKVDGEGYPGSSTTQELLRGAAVSEMDYVNGEIVLMGRMLGIPTPVNTMLQELIREMLKFHKAPYSFSADDLRRRVSRD